MKVTLEKKILLKEVEYIFNEIRDFNLVLDVGCGIGEFEKYLLSFDIMGLDVSEDMIRVARKRSNAVFIIGDAKNLMIREDKIDVVFSVATIEFLEDYLSVIKEIYRVLRKNGKMLVMILNPRSEYFNEEIRDPDDYFRRIKINGLNEIRKIISEVFRIVREEYFLGIKGDEIFETDDERYAAMYLIVGLKE